MDTSAEASARIALSLAAAYQRAGRTLDAAAQREIVSELSSRMDRSAALRRRDDALRRAFNLLVRLFGEDASVRMLSESLQKFETSVWPNWRWCAQPPDDASPLRRELFDACQAASAAPIPSGVLNLPGKRQLYRVVTSACMNVTLPARQ